MDNVEEFSKTLTAAFAVSLSLFTINSQYPVSSKLILVTNTFRLGGQDEVFISSILVILLLPNFLRENLKFSVIV